MKSFELVFAPRPVGVVYYCLLVGVGCIIVRSWASGFDIDIVDLRLVNRYYFLMKTIYMVGISFSLDLGRSISVPGCSS